ncbi:TPA: homoserine kinase [Candidatus Bathyarchaeota archaeon]|nr:homoserine kinase [Candidatus Bathyarchaeota archaeon]
MVRKSDFKLVVVESPATTANLGPGFDVFGLALEHPRDKVTLRLIPEGMEINVSGIGAESIPTSPENNTAGVVAREIMRSFKLNVGLRINIEKGVKPGVGLGSSAASAVAVAYGLNVLFDLDLNEEELIKFAAKGEAVSAGFEHADNVAAALCGGFVIIKSYEPLRVLHLNPPENMILCIAVPDIPVASKKTEKARAVLPKTISLENLVHNVGNATSMVVGFLLGDIHLIGESMLDVIVEPARASLIPGYEEVKRKALKAGAYGVTISGAGPSIIAIADIKKVNVSEIVNAMKSGFEAAGIKAEVFTTRPGGGTVVVGAER